MTEHRWETVGIALADDRDTVLIERCTACSAVQWPMRPTAWCLELIRELSPRRFADVLAYFDGGCQDG